VKAVAAPAGRDLERDWWLRALLVLQSPRPVFAALRDDSREAVEARQEPITALVVLAGMALFLLDPSTHTLMDSTEVDTLTALVIVFIAGGFSGLIAFWLGGGALAAAMRGVGAEGSYRRARHVVAFACAPLALSLLLLWPVRISIYGADLFRSGGSDSGTGATLLAAAELAFAAWSVGLLLVGLRVTYRLPWRRIPLAALLTGVAFVALLIVTYALFHGAGGG
jgi:hypothetical protein